jgi:para-nitrobenzyl esterase
MEDAMIQLSKQWVALHLPADARHAPGPNHKSPRGPYSQSSSARKASRKTRLSIGLVVALGTLCASWSGVAPAADTTAERKPSPVVETKEGRVQGFISNGITKFLGIPYAEPPVGNLRWQPPKDHAPWTNVLQATEFAPICALTTTLGVFSGPRNNNEDCLYLNVFTPDINLSASLPVIVYVHGGGNYDGETPGYDGGKLAAQGKVVVVTMEYRLNLMGFLAHPALDNEGHLFGNYGILDKQAVLKWVERNIAKFGGDKNNVTVGGQSSGAIDTIINLVSPLATGLFHRAICQSACPANYPLATKAAAEATGVAFAEAAGCGSGAGPDVAQCLRNLPAAKVEELAGTASALSKFIIRTGIVDGQIVTDQPLVLFKNGRFNHVPLMNGATKDEGNFHLAITEYWSNTDNALRTPPTAEQYLNYVNTTFVPPGYSDGTAARVLALYPLSAFKSPQLAWDRVATDAPIVCNARKLDKILAPQVPVYAYEFADVTAPSYFPDMPGMELQANHTADIQYLFPLWHGGPQGIEQPLNGQQRKLSDQMVSAWTNFARMGNPNGSGNSPWPRYATSADRPAWLIEDLPGLSSLTDRQYSMLHHCDFWDMVSPTP